MGKGEVAEEAKMNDLVIKLTPGSNTVLVKKGLGGSAGDTSAGSKIHVVKKGDTLWDIARLYTGDPYRYPVLAADSDIRDPDLIFPVQRIFIVLNRGE